MATTRLAPEPVKRGTIASAVAVVAADQFAGRRITSALGLTGLTTLGPTRSVDELVGLALDEEPRIVVLQCDPSTPAGLASVRKLASVFPHSGLVVVSTGREGGGVRLALSAGAAGVVYEADLDATLAPTTSSVLVGHISLPRSLHRCVFKPAFSHREKQVLAMVVRGFGNRQIADRLFLAESTVKSHLASAFQKLGVRSRKEAAAVLLDPDEGLGSSILGVEIDQPVFAGGAGELGR